MAYKKQTFVDHVEDENGNVIIQGTLIKKHHLDHIEEGIAMLDRHGVPPLMAARLEEGSKMTIRCKDWTETEDFVWCFNGIGSKNKAANLQNCGTIKKTVQDSVLSFNMSKTDYKSTSDDTAPIQFNGSYYSGNHAMTASTTINVSSHSLTEADIGSTWKDSDSSDARNYMLARVDSATKLTFINLDSQVTSGNGAFNYGKHNPVSPLVHVKNATHTGDIAFDSFVNSEQLWSGSNHVVNKYYVDDVEITEDGLYVGAKVHNVCSYDIIYIPAILEYLEANVGHNTNTSHYSDDIQEKYIHMEVIHEFRPNGSQTTYCKYQLDNRSSLKFSYIYTAQVAAFGKPCYLYVPGVSEDAVMLHNGTQTFNFNTAVWNDENVPPYRYFAINNEKTKGFEIVFSRDTYWGKPENRVTRVKSASGTAAGWSPSTCKLYPIFTSGTFPAGSSFDSVTGRIPLNMALNNGTTAIGWYWEHDDIIMTIDSHEQCNVSIPLSEYMRNKRVEVLDITDSIVSYPPYRTGDSIHYATNAEIGHLVIRLYD